MIAALVFVVIVDQMDGDIASVEVDGRSTAFVSLDLLPPDVREGDQLVFRIDRRPTPTAALKPRKTGQDARVCLTKHNTGVVP